MSATGPSDSWDEPSVGLRKFDSNSPGTHPQLSSSQIGGYLEPSRAKTPSPMTGMMTKKKRRSLPRNYGKTRESVT